MDLRVVGVAFRSAIPARVVVGAILVAFTVSLIDVAPSSSVPGSQPSGLPPVAPTTSPVM
jgi:hypothetical protein